MTIYRIHDIFPWLNPIETRIELPAAKVHTLLTDSRNLYQPEQALFFAINGERHNGHHYLAELVEQGVRNFVVEQEVQFPPEIPLNVIRVDQSIAALQRLAAAHRMQFNYPVMAITGSNGKTMVKEWLYQLLDGSFQVVRSPRSYNSQVGVPLSVWNMTAADTLGIFEAGISRPGEMAHLQAVIQPDIGIFTNLGDAHSEGFINRAEKLHEKMKLFTAVKQLVYCLDHEEIHMAVKQAGIQAISWSAHGAADLQLVSTQTAGNSTLLRAVYKGSEIQISIPFTDAASLENAMHAWLAGLYLGVDQQILEQRFRQLHPVEMRLQMREGINNCEVINDSYSADINSLRIALDFLERQDKHQRKTLIISDILQSGIPEEALYREVAEAVKSRRVNRLIGIGEQLTRYGPLFDIDDKSFYATTSEFLQGFHPALFRDETILLKGARVFAFERISKRLEKRAHETVLEINLNAIEANLNYFRSLLHAGTRIMAMVKAYSYGSGSYEIARLLQFHRVGYLGVAYPDEGIALRKSGISLPIMVMNTDMYAMDLLLDHHLEPVMYNMEVLHQFLQVCKSYGIREAGVHLEFDTGMHRLGFEEHHLPALKHFLQENPEIKVKSVFSHLAASDERRHDEFTHRQIGRFKAICDELQQQVPYPFLRHICNTGGILRFPGAHLDMVRLGVGLYGVDPTGEFAGKLQPVTSLKTHISQVRDIGPHETVGYSRKAMSDERRRIAVIAIGYADGLNRALSNGKGEVLVKGHKVPITGNVCMDMTMIDVTGLEVNPGDEVTVFGPGLSIDELAGKLGTIPYEILTGISQRVKRVYYYE